MSEASADETGTAVSADGVPIRYEAYGAGEPALVFVHGWALDRRLWAAQVASFAPHHRVVTLDLAGHGESGRLRTEWTMGAFAEDVCAVLDQASLGPSVLIGHSMSG